MFCTFLMTLILARPHWIMKLFKMACLASFTWVVASAPAWAEESIPMPSVEVVEAGVSENSKSEASSITVEEADPALNQSVESKNSHQEILEEESNQTSNERVNEQCRAILVNHDIENRYLKIQKNLESDYKEGMPKQLKTDLIRVREDIDGLTTKLFDVNNKNPQEVNHIVQLTVDYLEKMISLLPKANRIAPMVRDRYVVPFTNMNSIRAEHQECLMRAAIEDVQKKDVASGESTESSANIYRKLTHELEKLNESLYTLQTTDVQRFITYRARLLNQLESYNKDPKEGGRITAKIPKVLNSVHNEIERLIPGLELSKNY